LSGGRFGAAHAVGADGRCVAGAWLKFQDVTRTEVDVPVVGMEDDAAGQAHQRLVVAVVMPAVGVTGPVGPRPEVETSSLQLSTNVVRASAGGTMQLRSHERNPTTSRTRRSRPKRTYVILANWRS
jgi:hypothetical protein